MALRIQNNISSLVAQHALDKTQQKLSVSLERLSSGFRINRAADDAAGLTISQGLRGELAGFGMAANNASQASSMLQVAEGALDQIHAMLTRLRELATQAASDNTTDRSAINSEASQLINEIDRIVNSTKYSGTLLLDGTFGTVKTAGWSNEDNIYGLTASSSATAGKYTIAAATGSSAIITISTGGVTQVKTLSDGAQTVNFSTFGITFYTTASYTTEQDISAITGSDALTVGTSGSGGVFQVGAENNGDNRITISISSAATTSLGTTADSNGVNGIDLSSRANAQKAIDVLDEAIDDISTIRSSIGGYQNRLSYAAANLSTTIENVTAAESVIRDADLATEMSNFTKYQILQQAGVAMLAQANVLPQAALTLLGG